MELWKLIEYMNDVVRIYHEPRNDMVENDLLLGIYDLANDADFERCKRECGNLKVKYGGVYAYRGDVKILVSK